MKQLFLRGIFKPSCLWDSALSQHFCRLSEPDPCSWQHFLWGAIYCKAPGCSAVASKCPPLTCLIAEPVGQQLCKLTWQWRRACGEPKEAACLAVIPCKAILRRRETVCFWLAREGYCGKPLQFLRDLECLFYEFMLPALADPSLCSPSSSSSKSSLPISECTIISMVTGVTIVHLIFLFPLFFFSPRHSPPPRAGKAGREWGRHDRDG